MKSFINFLNTDIKIINSYFLFAIILIILVCIGYSSYALFSFTKTSTNIIEGTVGELKKSAAVELIKLTNNKDNSGLYTITHAKDSTLQIGTNEDITEYRYRGAGPKNYVTFNNEVWRIIGIFPVDDGTGNIENRIKIIRNDSIGIKYWNTTKVSSTSSYNDWTGAILNIYLNGTYLSGLTSEDQNIIGTAKYYLGGYNGSNVTADVIYQYERKISGSGTYYYGTNPNSWIGKIALMYLSDYGYAASDECTKTLINYSDSTCKSNNWLFDSNYQWTLFQNPYRSYTVYRVVPNGNYGNLNVYENLYNVRPTLYLVSSTKITGGSGTSTDPYTLGI